MKKKILTTLVLASLLCSCSNGANTYEASEYTKTLTWKDNFKICLLSDTHFSTMTNLPKTFEYLENICTYIDASGLPSKPDLIILNGDTFMNADRHIVDEVFKFFNDFSVPFALTNGNHDFQGRYTSHYLIKKMNESTYCYNVIKEDDDVYGFTNSVINLKEDDTLKFQIYLLDSNSYFNNKYDIIHDDQISWYERMLLESHNLSKKPDVINEDTFTKSLMFFHIPLPEYIDAVNEFKAHESYEEGVTKIEDNMVNIKEVISCGYKKNDLLKVIQEYKSTVGIACSHDHTNSMDYFYTGEDMSWPVRLMYGNKSTSEIYYDESLLGSTFFTLKNSPTMSIYGNKIYFDMEQLHVSYDGERSVL